jgi:preprotein translocase subunit SecD
MMEQFERRHKTSFWSILTANIVKLLVMAPYIVKSFVGIGLIANQK